MKKPGDDLGVAVLKERQFCAGPLAAQNRRQAFFFYNSLSLHRRALKEYLEAPYRSRCLAKQIVASLFSFHKSLYFFGSRKHNDRNESAFYKLNKNLIKLNYSHKLKKA